jgi:hypothetical protein
MSVWYQVLEANCNEVTLAQDLIRRRKHHAPYRTLTQEEFHPNFPQYTKEKEGVEDNEQSSHQICHICQKWSKETVHLKNEIHDTSS